MSFSPDHIRHCGVSPGWDGLYHAPREAEPHAPREEYTKGAQGDLGSSTMTTGVTQQILASQLELADLLRAGRDRMWEPQELPGRYGRVVRAGPPSGSAMARQWWQGAGRFGAMVTGGA